MVRLIGYLYELDSINPKVISIVFQLLIMNFVNNFEVSKDEIKMNYEDYMEIIIDMIDKCKINFLYFQLES